LEALTAGNVQRMVPIARAGEGIFEDHIAVSPTGNLLAVATAGGVLLVDTATGQRRSFLASPSSVESVAFSPDGRQLAAIHREPGQEVFASGDLAGLPVSNPILTMVDLATGKARYERNLSGSDCGKYAAWDLAFAPDGKTLVFRDFYSLIGHARTDHLCLLSTGDGALLRPISIDLPWRTASPVVFTPDGKQLMVSGRETSTEVSSIPTTRIRIIETDTGKLLREIDGQGMVYDMALSPDGATLALADQRGARLLSVQDGRLFGHVGEHMREAISVGFTPDGTKLALGSLDGTASLWSIRDGQRQWQSTAWKPYSLLNAEDAAGEIWDMAFSSDGAVLLPWPRPI
jgi:WD40 repeat protein